MKLDRNCIELSMIEKCGNPLSLCLPTNKTYLMVTVFNLFNCSSELQQMTFSFSSRSSVKIKLNISCESSVWQVIHMKYQDLFSLKKKKEEEKQGCLLQIF